MPCLLEMTDIRKEFPGVVALDGVDFQVEAGEILPFSVRMGPQVYTDKDLSGTLHARRRDHLPWRASDRDDSQKVLARGIGFIHQERVHIPYFTVGQMLFLGHEPRKSNGLIDWQRLYEEADAALASTLGAHIDSRLPMQHLSVSEMQLVDITKILMTEPSLIVFDEPTASLSEEEVERLFAVIRNLKERGVTVIYVSHRLDEIFKICDRATVLKDGKRVGTVDVKKSSPDQIVTMMVGRKLEEQFPKVETKIGKPVLEVTNLTRGNAVRDVSFTVREGEILGVYGLVGAGRTETMRLVFGADPKDAGTIRVDGREVDIKSPGDAVRAGVALVPEDRRGQGVLVDMSVRENTTLASLKSFSSRGFLKLGFEGSAVAGFIKRLAIRTPSSSQLVRYLSGGNQQKVVLAKWMASKARVFIFDQPTIGVDVGAKAEICRLMGELAAEGAAVAGVIVIRISSRSRSRDKEGSAELSRTKRLQRSSFLCHGRRL